MATMHCVNRDRERGRVGRLKCANAPRLLDTLQRQFFPEILHFHTISHPQGRDGQSPWGRRSGRGGIGISPRYNHDPVPEPLSLHHGLVVAQCPLRPQKTEHGQEAKKEDVG